MLPHKNNAARGSQTTQPTNKKSRKDSLPKDPAVLAMLLWLCKSQAKIEKGFEDRKKAMTSEQQASLNSKIELLKKLFDISQFSESSEKASIAKKSWLHIWKDRLKSIFG